MNKIKHITYASLFFNNWPLKVALLILLLLCFGYNYSTRLGLFPDEAAHLGFVINVMNHGFPDYLHGTIYNSEKFNYLEHPALYYILSGTIGKLLFLFHDFSFKTLRFINFFISSLSFYFIYRSLLEMNVNKTAILFSFIPVLCIPMFIILSASINNDPLMILGCVITFYSFVVYYSDREKVSDFIRWFLLGCVITSLTKATGTLGIVCVLSLFIVFSFRDVKSILIKLNKADWILVVFSVSLVVLYYGFMHHHFGKFFPSAQENPSFWFAKMNPDAERMGIKEHLVAFYHSNAWTLVDPYGHQSFIDTIYREKLLVILISSLPIFLCITVYQQIKTRGKYLRLVAVFGCAYVLYMCLYFGEIHRMHLATGYPGAMQSRYFYGFLPFFITIYALAFDSLKNAVLKFVVYGFLGVALIFSFYPSYAPLLKGFYGQEMVNANYGELIAGRVFEQTFTAKNSSLNKIEINLGTYNRINKGQLKLSIYSSEDHLLRDDSLEMSKISDNNWATFKFNGLALSPHSEYKLKLTSADGKPGNAITWWALGPFTESPLFRGTQQGMSDLGGNRYLEGLASVDGKRVDGTFSFRIYY
ncbi:glycosyltransferase family 39 protein [Pantoea sp. BAV 3049]|uniref:ArnT family glycosyltransferase n=1 Tax=Pantoea sp. BAV 3049 TaxID=2654188 RepID=UPI0018EECC6C|nr:phospholipid carrier-dependent glycosyltransferase [Pantoea sp. BAV 3049]